MKDKAQIDEGRIPKDILSDAKLLPILALLFRALRDEKPTAGDMNRLIALLRKGTYLSPAPLVCQRIEKGKLRPLADQIRAQYFPENTLPVDAGSIFRGLEGTTNNR